MNEPEPSHENEPAELEKFIWLLDRLRDACGRPSLRELSRVSKAVKSLYGGRYPKLPAELSLTALSDVLGRRRKNPPTWNWVASYVLSCQRYAAESGVRPDPKDATLPTWHLRLQAVHRSDVNPPADEQMIPGKGREPLSAPTPLDGARFSDAPADSGGSDDSGDSHNSGDSGDEAPDRRDDRQTGPDVELEAYSEAGRLSLSEQRLFGLYGAHGVQLLRSAEDGRNHDAEYRLGVLLCLDDRPQESLAWLLRADAGGHAKARELIEDPAPRRAALGHAWELGTQAAQDEDDYETAALYLECAARKGHTDAAFDLGALHMGREEPERAAAWFAMAAESGSPLAGWSSPEWSSPGGPAAAGPRRAQPELPTVDELLVRLYGEPPAGSIH